MPILYLQYLYTSYVFYYHLEDIDTWHDIANSGKASTNNSIHVSERSISFQHLTFPKIDSHIQDGLKHGNTFVPQASCFDKISIPPT